MDVVSHCSLPVAGRVWRPRPGAFAFTFVCKATFSLAPGKLTLAPEQLPVIEADRPWSETVKSLYAAADMVPRKLRADVVLIGNAYAPGGAPVPKLVARLLVGLGEVDKSIEVWGDRTLRADGSVVDGHPFTKLPLLYERAAGGPGTDNPVGMPPERDAYGSVPLPNLALPGARVALDVPIAPAGFGPIAARWPTRLARLGRTPDELNAEAWHEKPLPADLDMMYFNVAPADQQISALTGDERIVLENLSARHAQLAMTLPGLRPQARLTGGPGGEKPVPLRCDTLWIDTGREICCLTYRGQVVLSTPADAGWVVITLDSTEKEAPSTEPSARAFGGGAPIVEAAKSARTTRTVADFDSTMGIAEEAERPTPMPPRAATIALPFLGARESPVPREARASGGLPFQSSGVAPPPPRRSDPGSALPFRSEGALGTSAVWPTPTVLPAPARPPPLAPLPPPTLPPVPVSVAPAPVVQAPAAVSLPASDSPWAAAPSAPGAGTIAPLPAYDAAAAKLPPPGDFRSGGGAALASNAAAGSGEARSAPRGAEPARALPVPASSPRPVLVRERTDALDLLFFDAESVPRMRRVPAWKKLIAELEEKPLDAEDDDPATVKDPIEIEDRREALEILLRAEPSDPSAIEDALTRAVREDGRFVAPLLLLAGELSTPFDEIETLKATMTTVTPLAGTDESLRASLEVAKEFLKLPGLSSSPAVAEGLTGRLREAFNQGKRAVQPGYLDTQTERALVDQRFYQKRTVLGGRRQRALFHFVPAAATPLVAYLTEAVAPILPMHTRFKVRLIARAHPPLDPYESSPVALEVLALARLCPPPRLNQK
jgi:hypothetical protein